MITRNKTAEIKANVSEDIKKRFKDKAEELGLTTTGLIEKIAMEKIVFLDANLKKFLSTAGALLTNS